MCHLFKKKNVYNILQRHIKRKKERSKHLVNLFFFNLCFLTYISHSSNPGACFALNSTLSFFSRILFRIHLILVNVSHSIRPFFPDYVSHSSESAWRFALNSTLFPGLCLALIWVWLTFRTQLGSVFGGTFLG